MKTISIVCYNRPAYLSRTLESLKQCDWSGYSLFLAIEKGAPAAVVDICNKVDWIPTQVHIATHKLGCDRNTYRSIQLPFDAGSEFNIYWEDDIECSRGLRELADWYEKYNDRENACMCLESYTDRNSPTNEIRSFKGFNSHGLMCNAWQFNTHFRKQWLDHTLSDKTKHGWDWNMMNYITTHPTLKILAPMHAYSHHIGEVGTYCNAEVYHRLGQHTVVLCHDKHNDWYFKA